MSANHAVVGDAEPQECAMNPVILGSCVVLALAGSAGAGPCTTEIDNVSRVLASRDAGSGPTAGSAAATSGSQHPPTEAMSRADPSTTASRSSAQSGAPQQPPTAAMTREATGTVPPSTPRQGEQHPPTAATGSATYGTAAAPEDVQRQTEGRPTAAQQAQGRPPSGSGDRSAAFAALDQARALDAQSKESECMQAVGQARQHAGQ
jgi:hypothetical protein